ncbi:hypothetical protein PK98_14610 [Croceibacterium mercuriale]|uniref:DUF4168 domain-containing protein n=2 Tax=Croceibacterium mercuriale TaxID=1572751 RepID=A0A0B2BX66_9SPHN|nr:hypothetical protein PK98_14610 [Croceibacterium mercuriale]
MRRRNYILIGLAMIASASTVSAGQDSSDRLLQAARTIGSMIGLSPEGLDLWAGHSVENSSYDRYTRSTEIDRAIGEQLALENPDRGILVELAAEQVAEAERLERLEQEQLIDIAFRLSEADRRTLGRYMVRSADESRRKAGAVLQALP